MCSDFRQGIRTCLNNVVTKIEHCSSYSEKYVPKFGVEIYDSVFNYYCKDDALALKSIFFLNTSPISLLTLLNFRIHFYTR